VSVAALPCQPLHVAALKKNNLGCKVFRMREQNRTANDALSQLSYTPTAQMILANAREAAKRDCTGDCYEDASDFCASAITSAAFAGSGTLPCAKSFAPPPLPPNSPTVWRSNAPMSCARPFV
jgi:hypothetical protein